MHASNSHIAVVGLGARTGASLVGYLDKERFSVIAVDDKPLKEFPPTDNQKIIFEQSSQIKRAYDCPLWLLSPGIPLNKPYFFEACKRGIQLQSEIDFAAQRLKAPILAITGSNGKSTTTALLGHILKARYKNVFIGGNFGIPLIDAVDKAYDVAVVELSSFQLELSRSFKPSLAVVTNLSPNHLDRHGSLFAYWNAKRRIFKNMTEQDTAFINLDEPFSDELAKELPCKKMTFSLRSDAGADHYLLDNNLILKTGKVSLMNFPLLGRHNLQNALISASMAENYGVSCEEIESAMAHFKGLEHRLERLGWVHERNFINDSKSTTPHATIQALSSISGPVILLAGGRAKTEDFKELGRHMKPNVKLAVLYGECGKRMQAQLHDMPTESVETLEQAFQMACQKSSPKDTILLSPANTSWDQFRDFEERGTLFKDLVEKYRRSNP